MKEGSLFDATLQNFIYKHTIDRGETCKGIREMKRENLHDVKLAQTRCQNFSMSKIDHLYNKLAVVMGVCFVLSC